MTEQMMTAAFYRGNRSFSVEQIKKPVPAAGEVCIRIAYCGICGTDMHVFHGNMDGRVGFERVIGHEMSGTIDSIGADVPIFSQVSVWWSGRLTIVVTALPVMQDMSISAII